MSGARDAQGGAVRRWLRRRWWIVYLVLLAASQSVLWSRSAAPPPAEVWFADVPAMGVDGPVAGRTTRVAFERWGPDDAPGEPVILIHGSPGSLTNFFLLGPEIASRGRAVYAVDLPGFGWSSAWVPSYAPVAHARSVLALMDTLRIGRAHVLGWSQGGGVALHMADLAPGRVASLTLLGSVGVQEVEGSGSFWFEHAKYAVGFAGLVVGGELIPHFGLLGTLHDRYAFICNFWETDQRPNRAMMGGIRVPTLIIQGRHDPLVPAWGAEENHRVMPASRLLMLDMSHFMPFIPSQASVVADEVDALMARHDPPDRPARTGEVVLAPEPAPPFGAAGRVVIDFARWRAWWLGAGAIALLFLVQAELAAVLCAALVVRVDLDFGVAFAGLLAGQIVEGTGAWVIGRSLGGRCAEHAVARRLVGDLHVGDWMRRLGRRPFGVMLAARFLPERRRRAWMAAGAARATGWRSAAGCSLGMVLWTTLALVGGSIGVATIARPLGGAWGWFGLVAGAVVVWALLRIAARAMTWTGRQQLKASATRTMRYEFWPPMVFYAPLVPWLVFLSIRHRGALVFTCVNPGISHGGGTVGESKREIMAGFDREDARVLRCVAIEPGGAQARVQELDRVVHEEAGFDGFPVIVKPDAAQRGYAVKLVRNHEEALAYFRSMTLRAVAQAYHPGPAECGVLWARREGGASEGRTGRIFSVTRKMFQEVVGDGRRTLEELVLSDRRLRCQWRVFLARFAHDASRVVGVGERVRLSIAGNHAQGAKFLDGADLVTPALEEAVDALCAGFRGVGGGGLDYGRFDLRYESDEALGRGEFAIVELNGAMSESTNIYDPSWSVTRAYATLFRQWALLYRLGAMRRREGRRPMGAGELMGTAWRHFRDRRGPAVSD